MTKRERCNYCDGLSEREPYACCEDCRTKRLRFTVELPDDGVTPWYRRVFKDTPAQLVFYYRQRHPGGNITPNTPEAAAFFGQLESLSQ